jgi:hypothetical protein
MLVIPCIFFTVLTFLCFGLDGAAHFHEVKRRRDKKKEVRLYVALFLWQTEALKLPCG